MNDNFSTPYIAFAWIMDVTEKTIKSLEGKKFNSFTEARAASHSLVRILSVEEFVLFLNSAHEENLNHYWFATVYMAHPIGNN